MKIHHVITGLSTGGAERNLQNIIEWTRDKCDHEVTVLTTIGPIGRELQESGIRVRALEIPRGKVSWRKLWQLRNILRQSRPDLIQTWMWHSDVMGGIAGRLSGCRKIFWNIRSTNMHDASTSTKTRIVTRCASVLSSFIPEKIIVNSLEGQRVHIELGYHPHKFQHIPNGFDTSRIVSNRQDGDRLKRELGIAPDSFVFISVGRLEAPKNHPLLLDSFARLKATGRNAVLLLVGRGCEEGNAEARRLLDQHQLRDSVHLLGERKDVTRCLSAADCFVSSSSTEGFPNAVAEAMSCGLPCVVTEVGDSAVIVGETGFSVPSRDAVALCERMVEMLEMSDASRMRLGKMARTRIVEAFSKKRVIDSYLSAWGGVVPEAGDVAVPRAA